MSPFKEVRQPISIAASMLLLIVIAGSPLKDYDRFEWYNPADWFGMHDEKAYQADRARKLREAREKAKAAAAKKKKPTKKPGPKEPAPNIAELKKKIETLTAENKTLKGKVETLKSDNQKEIEALNKTLAKTHRKFIFAVILIALLIGLPLAAVLGILFMKSSPEPLATGSHECPKCHWKIDAGTKICPNPECKTRL